MKLVLIGGSHHGRVLDVIPVSGYVQMASREDRGPMFVTPSSPMCAPITIETYGLRRLRYHTESRLPENIETLTAPGESVIVRAERYVIALVLEGMRDETACEQYDTLYPRTRDMRRAVRHTLESLASKRVG